MTPQALEITPTFDREGQRDATRSDTARRPSYRGGYVLPVVPNGEGHHIDTAPLDSEMIPEPLPLSQVRRMPTARERVVPPVLAPRDARDAHLFRRLQQWEGVVLRVGEDGSFLARLTDQTSSGDLEEAEFDSDDVPPADRDLLQPGAVFYWTIGYVDSAGGQRSRSSMLRFRRLPVWSAEELSAAIERAQSTAELIDWR